MGIGALVIALGPLVTYLYEKARRGKRKLTIAMEGRKGRG